MTQLYKIENKSFTVSLNVTEQDKYKVVLTTNNGGEFAMGFVTYVAASTFFDKVAEELYKYEH